MRAQERANRRLAIWTYLVVLGAGLAIGLLGFGAIADPLALSLALLVCGAAAIVFRPITGIYLIVFFAVLGDKITMLGYPFVFNFSSPESFLYLDNSMTFSPLELFVVLTAVSWLAHVAGARSWHQLGRPLVLPVLVFGGLVVVGLAYGVGLRGGNLTVAMWELRPLLYLAAVYVLASNLFTRTAHYVNLAWVVVLAVSIQNLFAIRYYYSLTVGQRKALEGLTEHPASLLYVWMFLLALAVCLFKGSPWARVLIVLAVIPSAYVFVLSERRAAAVALVAGFVLFAIVLFFRRRRAFFVVVPIALVLLVGYSAAFWHSTGGMAFGAQAVKSVIRPNELSQRDSASDIYRVTENHDLLYTIKAAPLTGIGFGKPFYQPWKLPDISFFVFYQYIPHNSVLWIWLNMGFVGFATLLFLIAAALRAGTRASLRLPKGDALAVTVAALAFVLMFFVFAYVDIAWDPRSCVFLAVCMATCANMLRLSGAEGSTGSDLTHPVMSPPRDQSRRTFGQASGSTTKLGIAEPEASPSTIAEAASSASLIVTSMSR